MHKCEVCNFETKDKRNFENHNKTIDHRIKKEEPVDFNIYGFYHNGIILYIGSSYDSEQRLKQHKGNCFNANRKDYNFKFYKYIRDNNLTIDTLENKILHTFTIDSKSKTKQEMLKKAHSQEQKFIDMLKPLCNQNKANTGLNESDYNKQYHKQYQSDNKDKIKQQRKQRYEDNKDEINKKINCNLCNKPICKQQMKRHQNRTNCKQPQPIIKKKVIITKKK
jgi:hypothetical protein